MLIDKNKNIHGGAEATQDILQLLSVIINNAEKISGIIENSIAYKNSNNEHHAEAVNNYNKIVTMNLNAEALKNSILNL